MLKEMEAIYRDDLLEWMLEKLEVRGTLMRTWCLRDIKKHSLPYTYNDAWNGLERDCQNQVCMNLKLNDKKIYGERTLEIYLTSCISQLGKYN